MLTFHPHGLHHGPQPGAVERDRAAAAASSGSGERRMAGEYAVMVDARRPLRMTAAAEKVDVEGYVDSWRSPR
jgi:homogentisate 1,2-dioxygenase